MIFLRITLKQFILYGSVARNESTPESDIDIAVIVKKGMDIETKDRFICWAADMDLRYDRVFSIVDIEKENLQKWGKILPFYQNVQKEGIVLWKAAEGISQDTGWIVQRKCWLQQEKILRLDSTKHR